MLVCLFLFVERKSDSRAWRGLERELERPGEALGHPIEVDVATALCPRLLQTATLELGSEFRKQSCSAAVQLVVQLPYRIAQLSYRVAQLP